MSIVVQQTVVAWNWCWINKVGFIGTRCDPVDSSYSVCSNITVGLNGTDYLITGEDILEDLRVVFKPWQSVLCIILYALIFRFLTYLALRHFHKPN